MVEADERSASKLPAECGERFFWHEKAWSALTRDRGKIPHALLLYGPSGLGKQAFAWRLARSLLCTAGAADGCGQCQSCRRFASGSHPDVLRIVPAGDSSWIVVDQVREIRQFAALTPHTAERKLVVLEPAEAMNLNAANALLKVLEEPPPSSLLILIASTVARLQATIRSRCTPIPFQAPAPRDAVEWLRAQGIAEETAAAALNLAGGAPLRARAFVESDELSSREAWLRDVEAMKAGRESPLRCAARWKSLGTGRCLEWFQRYLANSIQIEMTERSNEKSFMQLSSLFRYSDVLSEAKAITGGPLDESLLLEDILIRWCRLFRPLV